MLEFFVYLAIDFDSMCIKQPIGKNVFEQFCETDKLLKKCIEFRTAVVSR